MLSTKILNQKIKWTHDSQHPNLKHDYIQNEKFKVSKQERKRERESTTAGGGEERRHIGPDGSITGRDRTVSRLVLNRRRFIFPLWLHRCVSGTSQSAIVALLLRNRILGVGVLLLNAISFVFLDVQHTCLRRLGQFPGLITKLGPNHPTRLSYSFLRKSGKSLNYKK